MLSTLNFILHHPLNSGHKVASLLRYVQWQVGSRVVPGPVVVPFVNDTRLLVRPGMTSATGNIYCGLFEFEEMALVLHALRPEDTFVDVGANIGSFTVLAGAAVGCSCVSMEPCPGTFEDLSVNIRLNGIGSRCRAENVAVGTALGFLLFNKNLGAMNHVVSSNERLGDEETTDVRVLTLDEILGDAPPALIKIDVEGYEKEVLNGAGKALTNPALLAVIMEINTHEGRYGYDGSLLLNTMRERGFRPFRYHPKERSLVPWSAAGRADNAIFVRESELLLARVKSAPQFEIRQVHTSI